MTENYALPRFNSNNNLTVLTLDGKPVEVAHSIRDCLNFNFRGQKIGMESPLCPLSSELRSLDLFLCVCVKVQAYSQMAKTLKTKSMGHCNKCEGYLGHSISGKRCRQEVEWRPRYRWCSL